MFDTIANLIIYQWLGLSAESHAGAALLGVPLYSNATGVIHLAEAMLGKGVAIGTTLAFMCSEGQRCPGSRLLCFRHLSCYL